MGKYSEVVTLKVNKSKESHATGDFFNSLLLLKNRELLRLYPELREPHGFCIYCAKVDYERNFSALFAGVIRPIEDGIELRTGICKKCGASTSSKKKSRSSGK